MKLKFFTPILAVAFALFPAGFAAAQSASALSGTNDALSWFDVRQFGVEGRGWNDTKDF